MARFFQSTTPFTWAFCVDFIRPALQVLGPPALAEVLASVLMGQLTLSSVLVSRGVSGLSTGTVLRKREGISAGGQPAHCGAQEEWLSALARRRPLGRLLVTCAARCELSSRAQSPTCSLRCRKNGAKEKLSAWQWLKPWRRCGSRGKSSSNR